MAAGVNAPLYTPDILRLAASLADPLPLKRVDGAAEARSLTCGSRIRVEVMLTPEGRVEAVRQQVHACAFGQASAALLERGAAGCSLPEVEAAAAALGAWLAGTNAQPGPGAWPGLESLAPARSRIARHGAIMLPFRALAAAIKSGRA